MIKYDTYHDTSDQLPHGARVISDAKPVSLVVMLRGWYCLTGQSPS
jgi:hypothetical protein